MENRDREALKAQVQRRYELMTPYLNEQLRRAWAAAEALTLGRGGNTIVAEAIGISRTTLTKAKHDVLSSTTVPSRQRRPGGGRKFLVEMDEGLLDALDALIDPSTRGDPESPLRWTCKSTYQLAAALSEQGHPIRQRTVYRLLEALGYSLQANRKPQEGADPPDRDAQCLFIYRQVQRYQGKKFPVISVDTKKKENLGNLAQPGREWEPQGRPTKVQTYTFPDPQRGHVRPYGIYDLSRNEGWVNVGISRDTAQFAVESIRRWWHRMGHERYPQARDLLITADGGGSNGYRTRFWKAELQRLANELHLAIRVCHFPPGTRKWNKIEHRLCSFISKNWRGHPLDSVATVVNLIANTKTDRGLYIETSIDETVYEKGIEVPDDEFAALHLTREKFHGEWNYVIKPQR
jgi:DNA-binding phage protein